MEIYVSSNWKFGVNLMVFRGNGGEIRCCLQSIKGSLQIIDCPLTANEGRDNLKNIRELVRDQVNYRDAAKTLQTSLPSPCLRPQEKVNLQDFMKEQKLSNWKTAGRNNVVELHEHRNLFARMIIESLLQQTSQRFRSLKRISFTHQDKDNADRLSNTEDHQGWLAKQGTSSCSRRSEQAKISQFQSNQEGGRRSDYFTCHGCYSQSYDILSTQKFSFWLSDIIQVFARTPLSSPVQQGIIEKLFFSQFFAP